MPKRSTWRFPTKTMVVRGRTGGVRLPTPGRQARFGARGFRGIIGRRRLSTLERDLGLDAFRANSFPTLTLAQMKVQFFDRQMFSVAERAEASVLNRTGAVARLTAKRSMRWRKGRLRKYPQGHRRAGQSYRYFKPSAPGSPPHARRGYGQIRNLTFYWYDKPGQSVIIGPVYFSSSREWYRSSKTKPQLHEEGGTAQLQVLGREGFGSVTESTRHWVSATYPKRPYIKPAYDKTLPKFRQWWKDSMERRGLPVTVAVSGHTSSSL